MLKNTIVFNGQEIPVNVTIERRADATVRFGKSGVNIRIPQHVSKTEKKKILKQFTEWARMQLKCNPQLLERYNEPAPEYRDGAMIRLCGRTFVLRIFLVDRRNGSARLEQSPHPVSPDKTGGIGEPPENIMLELPAGMTDKQRNGMADALISLCVGDAFIREITDRVHQLNTGHFGHSIREVRLKNIKSRWGSCSSAGRINLSTRLLCAPPQVMDYVIIHELAHVGMFNHSRKFWDRVRRAMPDYEEHVLWLKQNEAGCSFDQRICGYAPPLRAAACVREERPADAPATPPERDAEPEQPPAYIERQISLSFDFE